MTDMEKEKIRYLRGEGLGYKTIASRLGKSENTVKGFCRRNELIGKMEKQRSAACRECGKPLHHTPGSKPKQFCDNVCRQRWWNAHPALINRKAAHAAVCGNCGRTFAHYGKQRRKYCSHACYIEARFGRRAVNDPGTV